MQHRGTFKPFESCTTRENIKMSFNPETEAKWDAAKLPGRATGFEADLTSWSNRVITTSRDTNGPKKTFSHQLTLSNMRR